MLGLVEVEKELSHLIDLDKKNWTNFYLLLKEIEEHELWKGKYNSFTQWVKDFSIRNKTHESIIWNRKKAGKVYENYARIQKEKGIEIPPIQKVKVSADSLVILDKINRYDPTAGVELVEKVINKGITQKDLREVYHSIRPDHISRSPHFKQEKPIVEEVHQDISALDIVTTLCGIEWLGKKKMRRYFISAYEQDKYRTFTEFPVYTGTSRKSRRIDLLACENILTENIWELNLHGFEIKISKGDLLNDQKYSEYAEFVDYLWLAIPEKLVEVAKENCFIDCGIISVSRKNNKTVANIVKNAKRLEPLRKIEALTSIALKLI